MFSIWYDRGRFLEQVLSHFLESRPYTTGFFSSSVFQSKWSSNLNFLQFSIFWFASPALTFIFVEKRCNKPQAYSTKMHIIQLRNSFLMEYLNGYFFTFHSCFLYFFILSRRAFYPWVWIIKGVTPVFHFFFLLKNLIWNLFSCIYLIIVFQQKWIVWKWHTVICPSLFFPIFSKRQWRCAQGSLHLRPKRTAHLIYAGDCYLVSCIFSSWEKRVFFELGFLTGKVRLCVTCCLLLLLISIFEYLLYSKYIADDISLHPTLESFNFCSTCHLYTFPPFVSGCR